MRPLRHLFLAVVVGAPLLAQARPATPDTPFWNRPDAVTRDNQGKEVRLEIRDRSNYTLQTFTSQGKWISTFHFAPHTDHVTYVESADSREDYLYDDRGQFAGYSVKIGPVVLTGRARRDGVLSAPGLPTAIVSRDQYDRVTDVRLEKGPAAATYRYDRGGYLRETDFQGYSLGLSAPSNGLVTETLTGLHGEQLHQVRVRGDKHDGNRDNSLDIVADLLGLGSEGATRTTLEHNVTASVAKVRNSSGTVVFYWLTIGGDRIGFDAGGKAMLYDIDTFSGATFGHMPGAETGYNPIVEQDAVIPKRLLITSDGRVGARMDGAAAGAISSLWVRHDKGPRLFFRTETAAQAPHVVSLSTTQSHRTGSSKGWPANHPSMIQPLAFYSCGSSSVCSTCDYCGADGGAGTSCTYTTYYCSTGADTGGGGSGGGGSGGGGGGGGTTNNHVSGSLQANVSRAQSAAATKLASQACAGALLQLQALNGQTLGGMLDGKSGAPAGGWTLPSFLTGNGPGAGIDLRNGFTSGPCGQGYVAHTDLYQNTIYICDSFGNMSDSDAAIRLIHEELHALGFPEDPPNTGSMTPSQISQMVASRCP